MRLTLNMHLRNKRIAIRPGLALKHLGSFESDDDKKETAYIILKVADKGTSQLSR